MTISVPVVLSDPPFERSEPRVTVTRHLSPVNAGDGYRSRFVLQYVVDAERQFCVKAGTRSAAALRAATMVRELEPHAVWLLDGDRTAERLCLVRGAWRPVARATGEVQAAFVAWHG